MEGIHTTRVRLSQNWAKALVRSSIAIALALAMLPVMPMGRMPVVQAQEPPVVDGLFYALGDNLKYVEYATSEYGSKLYSYQHNTMLYAALVLSRTVNDNVFERRRSTYSQPAGWQPTHSYDVLLGSDHAVFTLTCGSNVYNWMQDLDYIVNDLHYSGPSGPDGGGTPPPGITSGSSTAWNINNYTYKYPPTSTYPANGAPFNMYIQGTAMADWHSPYSTTVKYGGVDTPNASVVGIDGYPPTTIDPNVPPVTYSSLFEWEWPIVYEFSMDLTTACPGSTISFFAGAGHNSPSKNSDENDDFPPDGALLKDLGDLPSTFGTLLANNGPYHNYVVSGIHLGAMIDTELNGQPSTSATGDNAAAVNDEDGVTLLNPAMWSEGTDGGQINVTFTAPAAGTNTAWLAVWFDWNYDGNFDPATETAVYQQVTWTGTTSTQPFTFDIPAGGLPNSGGILYYRARLFTAEPTALGGTSAFVGGATGGEVEDYKYEVPTVVDLLSFTAMGADSSAVLTWKTASETENVGFNVYRSTWAGGAKTKVNAALIPSLVAPGSPFGAAYEYADAGLQNGKIYFYWLESVDIGGGTRMYGPAQAILIRRLMKVE